jgi:cytochrome o ubiquinol oxidase subunit 2
VKHHHFTAVGRMLGIGALLLLSGCTLELLSPKGEIGAQEKTLFLTATFLMLIVVVPVIAMTLYFAWKYRASNTKATYAPKWNHSTAIEVVVWTIPCIIVAFLAVITYKSSHALDPYRPIESSVQPINIDVVSMDWKWLFIYPDYDIATVNEIVFPVDAPLNFRITSSAMMNAFFIPQLGSMIYSMGGMETKLHLIANEPGTYAGLSSNYSGAGFSGMRFKAIATSDADFKTWVEKARASNNPLTPESYQTLLVPSENVPVSYYSSVPTGMFDNIIHSTMSKIAGLDPANCTPTSQNLIAGYN